VRFLRCRKYPHRSRDWRPSCCCAAQRWSSTLSSHRGSWLPLCRPVALITCSKDSTGGAPDNCNDWTAGINSYRDKHRAKISKRISFTCSFDRIEVFCLYRVENEGIGDFWFFNREMYRKLWNKRLLISFAPSFTSKCTDNCTNIVCSTRGPVAAHFSETLSGLPTLRAFKQEDRFMEETMKRLDVNTNAFLILNTSSRWLGIALVRTWRQLPNQFAKIHPRATR